MTVGDTLLHHDKQDLLSDTFVALLDSMGKVAMLSDEQEERFARVSALTSGLPLQVSSRLMERCRQPIRKDFTTLVAFMPAMRELLDKGALVGAKSKLKPLLNALAIFEGDPMRMCDFGIDLPRSSKRTSTVL